MAYKSKKLIMLEDELFDVIYAWGMHGVVANSQSKPVQDILKKIIKEREK